MRSQNSLAPSQILAALGVTNADAITTVTGGQDTVIWRVRQGDQSFALRVFRADQVGACRCETLAMQAAASAGLPVPMIHAHGVWQDRPAMLISWCPGQTLLEALQQHRSQIMRLGMFYGQMQARIHAVSAPDGMRFSEHPWLEQLDSSEDALKRRLLALPLRADALLHLDYHPQNVLCDQGKITGVIDWTNALAGDPRADLARTVATIRLSPNPPGIPSVLINLLRSLLLSAWRRGYQQFAGPIGDLSLFYAWAGAVIRSEQMRSPDRPGQAAHLTRLQKWTAYWKRRAGIVDPR